MARAKKEEQNGYAALSVQTSVSRQQGAELEDKDVGTQELLGWEEQFGVSTKDPGEADNKERDIVKL